MSFNKIEVLSPAGSQETLIAAVRSGADAVYLGAKAFSARRNAENFDNEGLAAAVEYCHIRGVKVYLTHNIMCKQSELADAVELARYASQIGVDGLIIQDLGLADAIHRACPDIELHASTQMSLHSPSALPILKQLGFCRVVAAREMSREQLACFCRAARVLDMEVEVFVHGALCMSVSGQCLLSSMLGGRSGNRGLCAGPCRLPFKAQGGTGFDLSLKDLSLTGYIDELCEMGVSSLKIEGRMKRPEYVAASTAAVRSAVDCGLVPAELEKALSGVFSRSGFTDGYFTRNITRDMFGVRTKDDVEKTGDTFAFLHELYRRERQSVPITVKAELSVGSEAVLTVCDGQNTVTVKGERVSEAQNRPATQQDVAERLSRLGGTPYFAKCAEVELTGAVFASGGALNALRRKAVEGLSTLRAAAPKRNTSAYSFEAVQGEHNATPQLFVRLPSPELMPEDIDGITVILPSEQTPDSRLIQNGVIVELPRWIDDEEKLKRRLYELKKMGVKSALCGNLSQITLCKDVGLNAVGGIGLNVCNSATAAVLERLGVNTITLTPEMTLSAALSLKCRAEKGIFAYGRLPLMLLRSCPIKNGKTCAECGGKGELVDRKGVCFPVRCRGGVSELLNSTPHYLADRLHEMCGLDFLLLYFTDETPSQVRRIINLYKNGGNADFDYTRGACFRDTV